VSASHLLKPMNTQKHKAFLKYQYREERVGDFIIVEAFPINNETEEMHVKSCASWHVTLTW